MSKKCSYLAFVFCFILLQILPCFYENAHAKAKGLLVEENNERILSIWVSPTLGSTFIVDDPLLSLKTHYGLLKGTKISLSLSDHNSSFYLGGGWASSKIKLNPDRTRFPNQVDFPSAISTSYGEIELSGYYRKKNWELGPSFLVPFGTDTSFSPAEIEEKPHFFAGFGGKFSRFDFRKRSLLAVGVQAYLDMNIDERKVFFLKFMFEVGFPVRLSPQIVYKTKFRDKIKTVVKYKTKTKNLFIVDAGIINFKTNRSDVNSNSTRYLHALARLLARNQKIWDHVDIAAHTDSRGGWQLNQELAKKRGHVVRLFFLRAGVPMDRTKLQIRASEDPVETGNNRLAYARNRRVEISVVGQDEMAKLKHAILNLQQRFASPNNCEAGKCL